ncbi:uncharacterized protein [Typha angustifolia]|uniref:uncharacterized protein n=1 Tax=Typha angustifolia TaxID=59011 RepID=UPI003C2F9805
MKELLNSLSILMAETNSTIQPIRPTPFLSNLLYKSMYFAAFVFLLPHLPSQAPDFVNQTIFRESWEIFRLLFVGLAVSYGVFSRKNADPVVDCEMEKTRDRPQSCASQILHGALVFEEDEVYSPCQRILDEAKIQSWSSLYYPNKPAIVVANGSSGGGHGATNPLLLPVGSLRSRDEAEESGVLPSPIPWRSRGETFDANPSKIPSFHKRSANSVKKKKKSSYKSSPPPPPPPPPPFLSHGHSTISNKEATTKSFKDELTVKGKEVKRQMLADVVKNASKESLGYISHRSEITNGLVIASDDSNTNDCDVAAEQSYVSSSTATVSVDENEVDKKADEFIAKFREQIRLQRIESIKRYTAHRSVRNSN